MAQEEDIGGIAAAAFTEVPFRLAPAVVTGKM